MMMVPLMPAVVMTIRPPHLTTKKPFGTTEENPPNEKGKHRIFNHAVHHQRPSLGGVKRSGVRAHINA
jgi:hypothetical protein